MNYSTAAFLINPHTRGIECSYEDGAATYTFKTLDQSIKKDDLLIVPTNTRHKFTIVKVVNVDVDVDLDSTFDFKWIVGKVDLQLHENLVQMEADMIQKIKSAETRRKREELASKLRADAMAGGADLSSVALANVSAPALPEE